MISNGKKMRGKKENLQTELETTGNEVKTNTAERIRIADSISSVKRDLDIPSEQLVSNTEGRTLAAELRAAKSRLEEVNNDLVSLIVENKNEIVKLQRVVGGKASMTTNFDMGGYRILNIAHPRDPSKTKDFESDLVTATILYAFMSEVDQNYMRMDKDVPRSTSYGVYISQLIRFARVSSHVVDFNARNKSLTAKLLQQGYRYQKLRKTFSKFYRRHYELVSKFNVGLKTLLHQGLSEPEFYGDLVYKFKKNCR